MRLWVSPRVMVLLVHVVLSGAQARAAAADVRAEPRRSTEATQTESSGPVLMLDLQPGEVPAAEVRVLDGLVAASVARALRQAAVESQHPLHSAAELRTLADVEAAKSLVGCDPDATSCLAELAGALGARYVLTGSVGRLGDQAVLQLSLLDTQGPKTIGRGIASRSTVGGLGDAVDDAVDDALRPLLRSPETAAPAASSPLPMLGVGTAIVGGLAAVAGFGGLAILDARLQAGSGATGEQKQQAIDLAWPAVIVGGVGVGVIAAGVVVAVVGAGL